MPGATARATEEAIADYKARGTRLAAAEALLREWQDIMRESEGVSGYRLNGALALWAEWDCVAATEKFLEARP